MAQTARQRPKGVGVVASLLILIGGVSTLIVVIEIIDSILMFGMRSLDISSPGSAYGFFLYGVLPVFFYSTGIGLFMARPWARLAALYLLPLFLLLFFLHGAVNETGMMAGLPGRGAGGVWGGSLPAFGVALLRSFLCSFPLIIYFRHPRVAEFFRDR